MASSPARSEFIKLTQEISHGNEKISPTPDRIRQFLATFYVDLLVFSFGATCGWTSPSIPILQSEEGPLKSGPISISEGSWIAAAMCPGGLIGNLAIGWLANRIGTKKSLYFVAIPQIFGWIIIYYANNPLHLIVSRFISGFSGGGFYAVVPSYISEIADDNVRGTLGSTVVFSANLGLFLAYVLGEYVEYLTIPWILAPVSILFSILFTNVPNSPTHFMRKNLYEEAEKSTIFFRNIRKNSKQGMQLVRDEMQRLTEGVEEGSCSLSLSDIKSKHAKKAIMYGIALVALNQFCGVFALINFTSKIFEEAGSNFHPNMSAIIVGGIQIIGSLMPALLVDRLGRRFMMLTSAIGTAIGLAALGTYTFLKNNQTFDMENFNWVPLLAFSFTIFISNCGVLTLPFMIISELCLPKIRGFVSVLCMSFLWIFGFLAIKFLPLLITILDMHGTFFLFAANSLVGVIFIGVCLPETNSRRQN